MHDPAAKITVPGRVGAFFLTLGVARLDPELMPSFLLYGLFAGGIALVLWATGTYLLELARKTDSRPNHSADDAADKSQTAVVGNAPSATTRMPNLP